MATNNCGCNPPEKSNEYLLISATGSEASACGNPSPSQSGTEDCSKQEPMFDFTKSDFVIPIANNTTQMEVCNSDIYAIDMWLQFLSPITTLRISNITGNILTLANRCPEGEVISSNPNPGTAITRETKFVVCDAPPCATNSENLEVIEAALSTAKELCLPSLIESSSTAIVHVVGRVQSDPEDSSAKKCLRKIYGFMFNAGTPILGQLKTAKIADADDYRKLVKHKTSNEVKAIENYRETEGLNGSHQKFISITSDKEKLIGPGYIFRPMNTLLTENTDDTDPTNWPTIDTILEYDKNLSELTLVDAIVRNGLDNIWAMVKLDIANEVNSINWVTAKLNGEVAGKACSNDGDRSVTSFTIPVKVMTSDWNLALRLTSLKTSKQYYRLTLCGVWF